MGYDKYFGFDLQQRKTLMRLLEEVAAGDSSAIEDLQDQITALAGRVTDLENA